MSLSMISLRTFTAFLSTLMLLALTSSSQAMVVISVENTFINADQGGFVDIRISSTGSDPLNLVNYTFAITNVGSPSSTLQFAATQFLDEKFAADYVFHDDLDPSGLTIYNQTNSELEQGDATFSFDDVTVTSSRLLARLELQHTLGPSQSAVQAAGEMFQITLQNTAGTFFENSDGKIDLNDPGVFSAASFTPGTITVQVSAVPEPSSLLLFATGGVALWYTRKRMKKLNSVSLAA